MFGCERLTLALKKCHLHKLRDDKLQQAELKERLHHYYHSHQLQCMCVHVLVCDMPCWFVFMFHHICCLVSVLSDQ